MSLPIATSADLLEPLRGQLQRLRARLRQWVVVDAIYAVLRSLVVIVVVDFVVDWLFAMDRPQRFVMLGLAIAFLVVIATRRLLMPLWRRPSDDALCLQIERSNRQLGESLISTLQFARVKDASQRGISLSMMQAAIQQGLRACQPIDVDRVLNVRRYYRNAIGAMVVGVLLSGAVVAMAATDTGRIWFQRNVLLLDRSWPQDTYLQFECVGEDGRLRVPRGMNWPLSVHVTDESILVPEEVVLEVMQGDLVRTEAMQAGADKRRFSVTLQHVTESLRIQAVSGRATTGWIDVELIEYPAVAELELETTLPSYAGALRRVLPAGESLPTLVEGTQLMIRGQSSKPLMSARIVVGRSGKNSKVLPMTLDGQRQFHARLPLTLADGGSYVLQLVDKQQVVLPGDEVPSPLTNRNAAKFTVNVRPDRPPRVRLQRGSIGQMVVPEARIPFAAVIEEEFGVSKVRMLKEWSVTNSEGASTAPRTESISMDEVVELYNGRQIKFEDEMDLSESELPPVGAELRVQVEATDNNDLTGPGVGTSTPLRFRIVASEQLRTDLLHRENVLRRALDNQRKRQIGIMADSRQLARRMEREQPDRNQQIGRLARLQKQQKQLAAALVPLTDRLKLIRSEIVYNRLDSENNSHLERLTAQVIGPLDNLLANTVPEAVRQLDRARRTVDNREQWIAAIENAIRRQAEIDRQLKAVLDSMIEDVEFQLVLDLLREVHGSQQDVLKRSEEERRRLIREFLEKHGKDGNPDQGDRD